MIDERTDVKEQMASRQEVPVVASRVGEIPEIASEGGVLLVEPNSAIELADVQRLIEDKDLRQKMRDEGLAFFRRRFTWTAVATQYLQILERQR